MGCKDGSFLVHPDVLVHTEFRYSEVYPRVH